MDSTSGMASSFQQFGVTLNLQDIESIEEISALRRKLAGHLESYFAQVFSEPAVEVLAKAYYINRLSRANTLVLENRAELLSFESELLRFKARTLQTLLERINKRFGLSDEGFKDTLEVLIDSTLKKFLIGVK